MQHLHNRKELKTRRTELRNNATQAEELLWYELRKSQLKGVKFRRHHSVGNYILDFYSPGERLAIELDGGHHQEDDAQKEYDRKRTEFLNSMKIEVIRFKNTDVIFAREAVVKKIMKKIRKE